MAVKVMCPVCKSEFMTSDGAFGTPITAEQNGVAYLVPKTIGKTTDKKDDRLKALEEAGIDVTKLQTLMQSNSDLKDIFAENDPVIEELSKGGFIKNPELFRRFITAQTFRLLKDPKGWTHAVRERYNTTYVFKQTKRELELLIKLERKGLKGKDVRFEFFTLDDMKEIFMALDACNHYGFNSNFVRVRIANAKSYRQLLEAINSTSWNVWGSDIPQRWLNCFKGAGAFYTLQNIVRTHGLVLLNCKDMNESVNVINSIFNDIVSYEPRYRRWDILLSVLTLAVAKSHFELKW